MGLEKRSWVVSWYTKLTRLFDEHLFSSIAGPEGKGKRFEIKKGRVNKYAHSVSPTELPRETRER